MSMLAINLACRRRGITRRIIRSGSGAILGQDGKFRRLTCFGTQEVAENLTSNQQTLTWWTADARDDMELGVKATGIGHHDCCASSLDGSYEGTVAKALESELDGHVCAAILRKSHKLHANVWRGIRASQH